MADWNPEGKASAWWYLAGIVGTLGAIIAILYLLFSTSKKKFWSLLLLIGFFGPIIVYLVCESEDRKLADLAKKMLVGNVLAILLAVLAVAFIFGAVASAV
jgi:hypothetical protein